MAPTSKIALDPLDHIAAWNIPQSVIYLSLKQDVTVQDAFGRLQEGLRRTFAQIPWLNGRVHWRSDDTAGWRPGQLEIRFESLSSKEPPHQLRFNELETDLKFSDLSDQGFPLDTFEEEKLLWTTPFQPNFEKGADVLTAQANFLPGGCALVLSVASPASDGTAMLSVTQVWAHHCNSWTTNAETGNGVQPYGGLGSGFERTALRATCKGDKRHEISSHMAAGIYRLVGLDSEDAFLEMTSTAPDALPGVPNTMKPMLFYLPQGSYTALRKDCIAELGPTDVSGNDLICALIWRSVVRAWMATQDAQHNIGDLRTAISEVSIPFDARPQLQDLLPTSYLGNVNFENRLALSLSHIVAKDTSIPQLAKTIRTHAATFAGHASLLGAYRLLDSVPDYKKLPQLRASRMKSPSVGILAPTTLPFNETCFGAQTFGAGGRPEAFRPLMGDCNSGFRTCFVMPRKTYGGIEFVMTLSDKEVNFLDKDGEFTKYSLRM
ncbi:transferase family protein [Aspergillus alliaceus]|uniref:Transferase family protein n=1 Tax=Petromyces alliaceus TaxID=209559 RepID=A0A5N7BQZ6_PETAA|nr:transferase family protein [Aspergillus alliaceus]KAB8227206.1 transferase family protein [Aspergillus alliaceus]KAE8384255.1 transferase family protein [Aspergillus alliaceus]